MIVVGVDAHSQTHTAAAVNDKTGEQLGVREVKARQAGHEQLLSWARELGDERVWAIEDCRHLSSGLERLLLEAGERVLRVPPKLMADARKSVRSFGKSDAIDALAVARAALREHDLPEARPAGAERELRLLSDHREDLLQEGTRYQRRLRWHLHEIDPDLAPPARGAAKKSNLDRLARQLARREQTAQIRICRELIRRIRELAKRVTELDRELAVLVRDHGSGCSRSRAAAPSPPHGSSPRSVTRTGSRPRPGWPATPASPHWTRHPGVSSATGSTAPAIGA